MNTFLVFFWVWLAMAANSFWEAYVEGKDAWNKGKVGWELRVGKYTVTAYHFWLWWVMWPLLLLLPIVAYGWNTHLFGVLLSAYASGMVLEDFLWFVVNPVVPLKNWNPHWAYYYPWLIIGRFRLPLMYVIALAVALLSWLLLW